ncbi:hypothetical protein ACLB2K_041135 [Fragaria x ananassa]
MVIEVLHDELDLQMLEVEGDPNPPLMPPQIEEIDIQEEVLQAMSDGSNASTMQLKGHCLQRRVHVLIDSGASHNFIHPSALHNKKTDVAHKTFERCELILGAVWLKTLSDIVWNFEKMYMRFVSAGQTHLLQGETETKSILVTCKSMSRLLRKKREAILVQLNSTLPLREEAIVHPAIQNLTQRYSELFESPTQLPPARPQDHKIILAPGTPPISVRPYRYPYSQKSEIEKIITDLLQNRVIRPSISHFSSPVLLVKKKDGSWWLCIDYRAVNAATIKDKYPILVVDELLDELHGATSFTKLDLKSSYHQIRMNEEDIAKTAFHTHSGHY